MPLTVLLAGGGTTGHISPMLAIAEDLRRREPDSELIMLGTEEGLETTLVPAAGFELVTIDKVPAPRRLDASLLRFPGRLLGTVRAVSQLIRSRGVDVVVGVGGYVSTPAYLAARRAGVPIVIHEANARPGLANRLGARLTSPELIGYTFARTPLPGEHVGMPMREGIEAVDHRDSSARAAAAARLGLDPKLPTLVVTGGSLGAQAINEACRDAMPDLMAAGCQILHITGRGKGEELMAAAREHRDYHVVDYVDGMENAYAAADLVICRAGAGTVAEVTAVRVPAVYVPLPIGNGEQRLNAADAVDAGAALVIDNADFTGDAVRSTVIPLLGDEQRRSAMTTAAENMDFPRSAAQTMVQKVYRALERPLPPLPSGAPTPNHSGTAAGAADAAGAAGGRERVDPSQERGQE
ncbi:undecaprenyldiphospho-muramoylpentapeptide beta-N-acetylglucosaminyltransferase [Brevibacterium daeguense]|uniref:UDP-N-acetylglucosamine--N-acetylmuramyl-(pentapeptide) pyrophosphoryl-undecaprenol N-acetylglucosamine transferase n=1 Tax=Brevibacterium daeguense TaxID=909936 RepID=A0ABP8EMR4_9MICO|nr:undecaprenyldiphospho-muramoylpentapeptide beta-N-acetylglucosaminyltransferase [Brevibacterium daeguense]